VDVTHDTETNQLRLTPTVSGAFPGVSLVVERDGILDIGEAGRLIGVEFTTDDASLDYWRRDPAAGGFLSYDGSRAYVQITDGDSELARTTPVRLRVEFDADDRLLAIAIPRRGHGYEISYPSGNQ
jgi:hypothetical protein